MTRWPGAVRRKYRLVRLPWWVRGIAGGLIFGGLLLAYTRVSEDPQGPLLYAVVGAVVAGVLFAVAMTFTIRAMERRIFDADGSSLTTDERIVVLQAVDAGRWPDDPRLHPAAARVVAQRFSSAAKPAFQVPVFVVMVALALLQAVTDGSWRWAAVILWLVAGPWAMHSARRQRQAAQLLRDTAPAGAFR